MENFKKWEYLDEECERYMGLVNFRQNRYDPPKYKDVKNRFTAWEFEKHADLLDNLPNGYNCARVISVLPFYVATAEMGVSRPVAIKMFSDFRKVIADRQKNVNHYKLLYNILSDKAHRGKAAGQKFSFQPCQVSEETGEPTHCSRNFVVPEEETRNWTAIVDHFGSLCDYSDDMGVHEFDICKQVAILADLPRTVDCTEVAKRLPYVTVDAYSYGDTMQRLGNVIGDMSNDLVHLNHLKMIYSFAAEDFTCVACDDGRYAYQRCLKYMPRRPTKTILDNVFFDGREPKTEIYR